MKPVDMSVQHFPDLGQYGDCQRACIASLLELDINRVPHFGESGDDLEFHLSLNSFLAKHGYFHLEVSRVDFDDVWFEGSPDCYHLIYGRTCRGTWHAVVGFNGEIAHDPHPSRAGLLESERDNWNFAFLVKANAAMVAA